MGLCKICIIRAMASMLTEKERMQKKFTVCPSRWLGHFGQPGKQITGLRGVGYELFLKNFFFELHLIAVLGPIGQPGKQMT